MFTWEK